MYLCWQQLHHLPVQTQSGQKIGIVEGVTIEIDSHSVHRYEIKPGKMLLNLFTRPLLIAPSQVVSITADAMIVKDSVMAELAPSNSEKTKLALGSAGAEVEMSERG